MGVSRNAFQTVGGFPDTSMHPGEDMVFSIEMIKSGFRSGLVRDAYVYHKRRTSLRKFFKQVFGFGKTRYIISKVYPETFSLIFLAPAVFLIGCAVMVLLSVFFGLFWMIPAGLWMAMVFIDASIQNRSVKTGAIAVIASFIQLSGYGSGFLSAWMDSAIRRIDQYGVYSKGFYPDRTVPGQPG